MLRQKRDALERADFSNAQFTLDLFTKDLGLALDESGSPNATGMPVTRAAYELARLSLEAGHTDQDYAALISYAAGQARCLTCPRITGSPRKTATCSDCSP